jgi:hypothetical protein
MTKDFRKYMDLANVRVARVPVDVEMAARPYTRVKASQFTKATWWHQTWNDLIVGHI